MSVPCVSVAVMSGSVYATVQAHACMNFVWYARVCVCDLSQV